MSDDDHTTTPWALRAALASEPPAAHQAHAARVCANLAARGPRIVWQRIQPSGAVCVTWVTAETAQRWVREEVGA